MESPRPIALQASSTTNVVSNPRPHAVDGGVAHAEVIGQPGEKDACECSLAQIASETGARQAIIFVKGGIGVDRAATAFAQNQFCVVQLKMRVKRRAQASLHAVVGPKHMEAMDRLDFFKRSSAGMI